MEHLLQPNINFALDDYDQHYVQFHQCARPPWIIDLFTTHAKNRINNTCRSGCLWICLFAPKSISETSDYITSVRNASYIALSTIIVVSNFVLPFNLSLQNCPVIGSRSGEFSKYIFGRKKHIQSVLCVCIHHSSTKHTNNQHINSIARRKKTGLLLLLTICLWYVKHVSNAFNYNCKYE